MSDKRMTGILAWYVYIPKPGYGVIHSDDRLEYFVHGSNFPSKLIPWEGMRVSFLTRPRTKGRGGWEAYDVCPDGPQKFYGGQPAPGFGASAPRPTAANAPGRPPTAKAPKASAAPDPAPTRASVPPPPAPAQKPPVTPRDTSADLSAVQEALRLRRERQQGKIPERVDDLAPGMRVVHPDRGWGIVQLVSRDKVSVSFDDDPRVPVDLPRDGQLRPLAPASTVVSTPVEPPKAPPKRVLSWSVHPGMSIGDVVRRMTSDVKERLEEEGLDASSVCRCEEAEEPPFPPVPLYIDPRVARAFETVSGIKSFYSHQVQAREALLAGKHVVLSTPTASGKTEGYNPTILETLLRDPQATALYVFPLVALGQDQTGRLNRLNEALPDSDRLIIGIRNSSVAEAEKSAMLKRENRIVVTTPDSLHYIFLPKPYPNWERFYRNLRYVVLDESHVYRGVLGANMANIVRRLLVRCRRAGNPRFPQIIISSATVRHPGQLAHQLTGLPAEQFEVIDRSGAPRSKRHYLVTRSDIHELDELCADLLEVTTVDVRTKKSRPVKTIVFLRSISEVKRSTERVREHLRKTRRPDLVSCVEEYYADKGDKNDVLARLRDPDGAIRCVFATTALMAGIDIGGLDVAIVKHFPGLVMDARQMFGRAGRVGEGAAIFIADRKDPFDQFYFERPEKLFTGETEEVVANPENPCLLQAHLKCAAHMGANSYSREGPLAGRWVDLFGTMGKDLLDLLVEDGTLRIQSGSFYLQDGEPHGAEPLNNLRALESETYTLRNTVDGTKLEEKRKSTAYRDAHPGAIVWCNGTKYRVLELDDQNREIACQPEPDSHQRTQGAEVRTVKILEINPESEPAWAGHGNGLQLNNGVVEITTTVPKYRIFQVQTVMQCRSRRCRHETPNLDVERCPACGGPVRAKQTEKAIEERPVLHDPPLSYILKTRATWLDFPVSMREQFDREFWPRWTDGEPYRKEAHREPEEAVIGPEFRHAIHSLEHAMLKAFPDHIRCDRDEIGGLYQLNPDGLAGRVFIYDNFPGGLGLADDFALDALPVLTGALGMLEDCTCTDEEGCPVCLSRYGCHSFNTMLSKLAGRYLLRSVTCQDTGPVIRDLGDYARTCIDLERVVYRPAQAEQTYGRAYASDQGLKRG